MDNMNYFNNLAVTDSHSENAANKCLDYFSKGERCLRLKTFEVLVRELFVDDESKSYYVSPDQLQIMFDAFDSDQDGVLKERDFRVLWTDFLCPILYPISVLIVVDVQNDFIDGSLSIRNCQAKQEGAEIVEVINNFIHNFDNVVYTYDWHPEDHVSFIDNVSEYTVDDSSKVKSDDAKVFDTVVFRGRDNELFEQKLWPKHCVQNTWGSELHCKLKIRESATFVYKGTKSNIDSYSAFWDNQKKSGTNLDNELKSRGVTDVYLCGLAYDYCVGSTAFHAIELGYRTVLIEDACRGVDEEGIRSTREQLLSKNACVVNSESIPALTTGRDRKVELGIAIAKNKRCDSMAETNGH